MQQMLNITTKVVSSITVHGYLYNLCDKVCQRLMTDQWYFAGILVRQWLMTGRWSSKCIPVCQWLMAGK